jgi:hypothetical protein
MQSAWPGGPPIGAIVAMQEAEAAAVAARRRRVALLLLLTARSGPVIDHGFDIEPKVAGI